MNKTSKILGIIVFFLALIAIGVGLYFAFGNLAAAAPVLAVAPAAAAVVNQSKKNKTTVQTALTAPQPSLGSLGEGLSSSIPKPQTPISQSNDEYCTRVFGKYRAEVLRNANKRRGPGVFVLYHDNQEIGRFDCITGGKTLDPHAYGGLTPTTTWIMVENVRTRTHPTSGSRFKFARIIPVGPIAEWVKRTFNIMKWPFMIHISGSSTGCIAIRSHHWKAARKAINEAFKHGPFPIVVKEV